jgi:AmmeMemoRadiSam system protein A
VTSAPERAALLALARRAIAAHLSGAASAVPDGPLAGRTGAAFVTVHHHGRLRGCIGHVGDDLPLTAVIVRCAIAAATSDPRFAAIATSELDDVDIELSLLGPMEPLSGPDAIHIGRHGVVVERGWRRGLLLPQVATEWRLDGEAFLEHACRKAGLPADAWRDGARLWRFEAEVFSEIRP